jgi:surface polysaccharide O-acyltransferase-like enzyme
MAKTTLMPTFLALGGYLIANKELSDRWMLKKIIKWGSIIAAFTVLYWIWAVLVPQWSMYNNTLSFGDYIMDSVMRGFSSTVMWYLFVMLVCYLILWLVNKIKWNKTILVTLAAVVITLIPFYLFQFGHVKWYGLFLFLGYIAGLNKDKLRKLTWITYPAIGGFAVAWLLTNGMTNWQDLEYGNGGYTIVTHAISGGRWELPLVMFGVSILGILSVIGMAKVLAKVKYLNKVLAYIGTCTLGIYVIHPLFIGISDMKGVSYVAVLGLSLGIYYLAMRVYKLAKLQWGKLGIENA